MLRTNNKQKYLQSSQRKTMFSLQEIQIIADFSSEILEASKKYMNISVRNAEMLKMKNYQPRILYRGKKM